MISPVSPSLGAPRDAASQRAGAARRWRPGPLPPVLLRLLRAGLAALLGVGLALLLGHLIARAQWVLAAAVLVAVPVAVLLLRSPWAGLLLWLLVEPYIDALPGAAAGQAYWVIHRALLPAALVALVLARRRGLCRARPVRLGLPELAMGVFLALMVASAAGWSWEPAVAVRNIYDRLFIPFCGYLLVRLAAPEERNLRPLLVVAAVTLVAQGVVAVLSWYAPDVLPEQWTLLRDERTAGSLRLSAAYTGALMFTALLLYHYALNRRARVLRGVLLALTAGSFFLVFLTFSRGSWLGAVPVLLGLLWVYPRATLHLALGGGLVLAVAILGLGLFSEELAWGTERLTGEEGEGTAEGRLLGFRALVEMTGDKPLLGWGYDSHQLVAPRYLRHVGESKWPHEGRVNSHNTFLTLSSELGVPALLLYLLPAGWWLAQSWRARRRLPGTGVWSWRLVALLWLVIAHLFVGANFVDMVRWGIYGTALWWISLGLIASVVAPERAAAGPGTAPWVQLPGREGP